MVQGKRAATSLESTDLHRQPNSEAELKRLSEKELPELPPLSAYLIDRQRAIIDSGRAKFAADRSISLSDVGTTVFHTHTANCGTTNGKYKGSWDGEVTIPALAAWANEWWPDRKVNICLSDHDVESKAQWRMQVAASNGCGSRSNIKFSNGTEISSADGHFIVQTNDKDFKPFGRNTPAEAIAREIANLKEENPKLMYELIIPHASMSTTDVGHILGSAFRTSMGIESIAKVLKVAAKNDEIVFIEERNGLTPSTVYRLPGGVHRNVRELFEKNAAWIYGADAHALEHFSTNVMFFDLKGREEFTPETAFEMLKEQKRRELKGGRPEIAAGFSVYDSMNGFENLAMRANMACWYVGGFGALAARELSAVLRRERDGLENPVVDALL
ncbi:Uncharacterised protein [uncultured archaeon]|nr:Uncharacterised protein [uncultured archaeon]